MEICLNYFRKALSNPLSVPPWKVWWAEHGELVKQTFSRRDYLRLKFRKLNGVRELLAIRGEQVVEAYANYTWEVPTCWFCGERTIDDRGLCGGWIWCPSCGGLRHDYLKPVTTSKADDINIESGGDG